MENQKPGCSLLFHPFFEANNIRLYRDKKKEKVYNSLQQQILFRFFFRVSLSGLWSLVSCFLETRK